MLWEMKGKEVQRFRAAPEVWGLRFLGCAQRARLPGPRRLHGGEHCSRPLAADSSCREHLRVLVLLLISGSSISLKAVPLYCFTSLCPPCQ